jgi:hypothetical protein
VEQLHDDIVALTRTLSPSSLTLSPSSQQQSCIVGRNRTKSPAGKQQQGVDKAGEGGEALLTY